MRQKIGLVVAGLVAGAVLMAVLPVQAHHGADFKTLKAQITKLKARTATLEGQTQQLDAEGFYLGGIVGQQVVSGCPAGATATWEQIPVAGAEDFRWLDDCFPDAGRKGARSALKMARQK